MIEVSDFYKTWVLFLKEKKLYGRYLLDIQTANKIYYEGIRCYDLIIPRLSWQRTVYLSKIDYFDKRFKIDSFHSLQSHLSHLSSFFTYEEYDFMRKTFLMFRTWVLEEKRNIMLKKKNKMIKKKEEENSPWYNRYYQDKKTLWRM